MFFGIIWFSPRLECFIIARNVLFVILFLANRLLRFDKKRKLVHPPAKFVIFVKFGENGVFFYQKKFTKF